MIGQTREVLSRNDTWRQAQNESRDREIQSRRYCVYAAPTMENIAKRLEESNPSRFMYYGIDWGKFPDGTDNITMEGFHPQNNIAGEHVLFIASFHNNDVTLSQFSVLIVLLQSFLKSLTVVLPFYPVGTNERVELEGKVATANTYSILLSNLPSAGTPNRLMIYDIHTLQNRFYFHGSTIPSLHSAVPLLLAELAKRNLTTIMFPDEGAAKRFKPLFKGFDFVICGKVRAGNSRLVRIQDGDPTGKVH
jgi:phosphoribosylpyrophosphate synthetase